MNNQLKNKEPESAGLVVWGLKLGYKVFFTGGDYLPHIPGESPALKDIRGLINFSTAKLEFYCLEYLDQFKVYTKFRTIYDWAGRGNAYLAFSLFLPHENKFGGNSEPRQLLDLLMADYVGRYLEDNQQISRKSEDAGHFTSMVEAVPTEEDFAHVEHYQVVPASSSIGAVRYNLPEDVATYFANPYALLNKGYRKVFFLPAAAERIRTSPAIDLITDVHPERLPQIFHFAFYRKGQNELIDSRKPLDYRLGDRHGSSLPRKNGSYTLKIFEGTANELVLLPHIDGSPKEGFKESLTGWAKQRNDKGIIKVEIPHFKQSSDVLEERPSFIDQSISTSRVVQPSATDRTGRLVTLLLIPEYEPSSNEVFIPEHWDRYRVEIKGYDSKKAGTNIKVNRVDVNKGLTIKVFNKKNGELAIQKPYNPNDIANGLNPGKEESRLRLVLPEYNSSVQSKGDKNIAPRRHRFKLSPKKKPILITVLVLVLTVFLVWLGVRYTVDMQQQREIEVRKLNLIEAIQDRLDLMVDSVRKEVTGIYENSLSLDTSSVEELKRSWQLSKDRLNNDTSRWNSMIRVYRKGLRSQIDSLPTRPGLVWTNFGDKSIKAFESDADGFLTRARDSLKQQQNRLEKIARESAEAAKAEAEERTRIQKQIRAIANAIPPLRDTKYKNSLDLIQNAKFSSQEARELRLRLETMLDVAINAWMLKKNPSSSTTFGNAFAKLSGLKTSGFLLPKQRTWIEELLANPKGYQ